MDYRIEQEGCGGRMTGFSRRMVVARLFGERKLFVAFFLLLLDWSVERRRLFFAVGWALR